MEEPAPYSDGTGAAAGGGNCRFAESPSQDQRLQAQRLRNPEVRGSLQTPQNRPHGHQSPELPEGYEQRTTVQGQVYFLHTQTGVSTWHDPRIPSHQCQLKEPSQPPPLPSEGSVEDEELPAQRYERDLVQKLKVLRHELSLQQPQAGHCRIEVSREEIFEESYRQIMKMRPKDLKKRLMVKFRGEEGLDYGGVAREWLYLLCHEMLNPYYGLFQYSTDNIYMLQINPDSSINPDHLSYFHFVGRIMGLAVFHGHYINGGFTVPFYKQLLGKPIQLSDLESVDPELHKSLVWILENDITPVLDHTFCVEHNAFGRILQHELKPNGRNVPVTEENKKEYVRLYVNWRFMRGIEAQFLALQKGFNELIPQHLLKPFDQKELELIIGGLDKIDLNDWKSNTRLKHCVADSNIVRWFWQAVETFDEERRARLLQFVTGSTRVPLQGFKALQGSTGAAGPRLFTIHLIDANTDNLPKAHTCFNRIDIPPYESYEKLYEKLLTAVEETCGFAVE
ncbi:E3 ubiquitin-protein ligase SMURF1 isoform X3 [Marmota marmota marmota]|uniref:E3 ubiquitin-protein ligase SMURF1 isoform X3 n=2 Tax=Marmota TaxID=9992 RepID=UPI002092792A|nr:E3 ubiquitin-protein ligase SMURF1 isoform X3 [Marmota marmota marmota]